MEEDCTTQRSGKNCELRTVLAEREYRWRG